MSKLIHTTVCMIQRIVISHLEMHNIKRLGDVELSYSLSLLRD